MRKELEKVREALEAIETLCIKNWDDAEPFADAIQGDVSQSLKTLDSILSRSEDEMVEVVAAAIEQERFYKPKDYTANLHQVSDDTLDVKQAKAALRALGLIEGE